MRHLQTYMKQTFEFIARPGREMVSRLLAYEAHALTHNSRLK